MPTKTFTSTSLCLLLLLSFGCAGPSGEGTPSREELETHPDTAVAAAKKSEKGAAEGQKQIESKLNDSNVVNFLSRYGRENPETEATIYTRHGAIQIELFTNTPLHRANFVYLVKQGYFDQTWFYRVSPDHVIQAGNTDKAATLERRRDLGWYTLPAEALQANRHRQGSLAAARSYLDNAAKRSDPYEFYIVLGQTYRPAQLDAMGAKYGFPVTAESRELYAEVGGAPHLDGQHTVFGRVVRGMETVEKINAEPTDEGEWPLENIPLRIELK